MKKSRSFISRIQTFMDSPKGRTYTNYIYSWGAAIVILGTLFKLTHIAGANLMLFIGMGAEVIVFFFSAFERPYELAEEDRKEDRAIARAERESMMAASNTAQPAIINGNTNTQQPIEGVNTNGVTGPIVINGNPTATPAASIDAELVSEMDEATKDYVEKIRTLNEAIQRIAQQSEALGRNMEEMETLSRNLTGINALYEVQLRSAGNQVGAIDQVNEETKKMARQIEELNAMYARMLEAMTINMNRAQ